MGSAPLSDADKTIVEAIKKLLQSEFEKKYPLRVLVRLCGKNKHRLTEIFHAATGVSITDYKISQRVEAAKKLLTTTQETIEDVALSVGYQNAQSFGKVFKKATGETPTEYRARHQ